MRWSEATSTRGHLTWVSGGYSIELFAGALLTMPDGKSYNYGDLHNAQAAAEFHAEWARSKVAQVST